MRTKCTVTQSSVDKCTVSRSIEKKTGKAFAQFFVACALVVAAGSTGALAADEAANTPSIDFDILSGGGHDVPTPFGPHDGCPVSLDAVNRRFELSDGEFYYLSGRVIFSNMQAYLNVNLDEVPWLAHTYSPKGTLYPLEGPLSLWRGQTNIRLVCRAHVRMVDSGTGPRIAISLEPIVPERYRNR